MLVLKSHRSAVAHTVSEARPGRRHGLKQAGKASMAGQGGHHDLQPPHGALSLTSSYGAAHG